MFIQKIPSQNVYVLGGAELLNFPQLQFVNPDGTLLTDKQVAEILVADGWIVALHFRTFPTLDDAHKACSEAGVTAQFVR